MATKLRSNRAAITEAVSILGGAPAAAIALNRSAQIVYNYLQGTRGVPADICPTIERLTSEAGFPVRCERLRPDVEWGFLRGTTTR